MNKNQITFGIRTVRNEDESVGKLLQFDPPVEKPKQTLVTPKQAQYGVTPNDVHIGRLNSRI